MTEIDDNDEREQEIETLSFGYPELVRHPEIPFLISLDLAVKPDEPMKLHFVSDDHGDLPADELQAFPMDSFRHLPALKVEIQLPVGYPESKPPEAKLSTDPVWLPEDKLKELEGNIISLWEEHQCQVLYMYLDDLRSEAERCFGITSELRVDANLRIALLDFQGRAQKDEFDSMPVTCGICFDNKRGAACYKMARCGHIFCKECMADFYTHCIKEGDVSRVQCMDSTCSYTTPAGKKVKPTIAPAELLQIPLPTELVRRYADLKRKKKLEADKSVVYCPRAWCQAPARSDKYPVETDLTQMTDADDGDVTLPPPVPDAPAKSVSATGELIDDRLRICEKCLFAFCRTCNQSWHGVYKRCVSRDSEQLSKEEQETYDYIRRNTSECPVCLAPVVKSMGCNHMTCFQCRSHFCYLCSQWLDPDNPYKHFNTEGKPCYHRLWDLEDGDEGNGEVRFVGARGYEAEADVDLNAEVPDLAGAVGRLNVR